VDNTKIITRYLGGNNQFRVRVIKDSKDIVQIHYEANYNDCYGWQDSHKPMRIRREEIEAAAKLLGLKCTNL